MSLNHPDYLDFFDEPRKSTGWERVIVATAVVLGWGIILATLYWIIF